MQFLQVLPLANASEMETSPCSEQELAMDITIAGSSLWLLFQRHKGSIELQQKVFWGEAEVVFSVYIKSSTCYA